MVRIRALCNCIPFLQPNGLAGSAKRASYKMCHGQNLHHWISNQFWEVIGVRVPTQQKYTASMLPNTGVKYNGKFLRDHVCHIPMCIIAIIVAREAGLWVGTSKKAKSTAIQKVKVTKCTSCRTAFTAQCTMSSLALACVFLHLERAHFSQLKCMVHLFPNCNVW